MVAQQIRGIAQRLIARVPQVTDAVAAEHGMQANHIEKSFDWDVAVLNSEQANAVLPAGRQDGGLHRPSVPVAQNADAMAVVMGHGSAMPCCGMARSA